MYREILRMLKINQENSEVKHMLNCHLKVVAAALPINNLLENPCQANLIISSEWHAFQQPKEDKTSMLGFEKAKI